MSDYRELDWEMFTGHMFSRKELDEIYEQGRAEGLSMAYDQIDEGVCHICEHYIEDHKCIKECNENGWERETFMKWLKEQNR